MRAPTPARSADAVTLAAGNALAGAAAQTQTRGRQLSCPRPPRRAGKVGVAAQNSVGGKARSKDRGQISWKVAHRHSQIERRRHPTIRLDHPLLKPHAQMVEGHTIAKPDPGRSQQMQVFALPSRVQTRYRGPQLYRRLTVPAVARRTSPLPGLRISASAFSPNASSGPASSICTEAATPLANFPLATTRELSTGWVSGSTIVVVSSARPVDAAPASPDVARLDMQICALMPLGFGGDQVGGDGPGNRLADQRTQITQPRHPQVELSQREARTGGQGKRPLGMSALPVGVLDRHLQPAIGGAGCGERQFERRPHQHALRGDVTGRFARQAVQLRLHADWPFGVRRPAQAFPRDPLWRQDRQSVRSPRLVPRPRQPGSEASLSDRAVRVSNLTPACRRPHFPYPDALILRPSISSRETVTFDPVAAADTVRWAAPPISAGTGAIPPVIPTVPLASSRVVPSCMAAVRSRTPWPCRSSPASAASGARFDRSSLTLTLQSAGGGCIALVRDQGMRHREADRGGSAGSSRISAVI